MFENLDDQLASQWSKPFIDHEDLATLQYTSGSTGKPKGVIVSHRNIIYNSEVIKQAYGHTENLIGVNWLPIASFKAMEMVDETVFPHFSSQMRDFLSGIFIFC